MDAVLLLVWLMILVGFIGSALFSGLETGAYTLNRVRLHVLDHHGRPDARTLRKLLDRPTAMLAALLISNNLTNYLGTAGVGLLLERSSYGEWQMVVLNVAIVTPLLFIFGETLPKDLFAAHTDRLTYRCGTLLEWTRRLLTWCGALPLVLALTTTMSRLLGLPGAGLPTHPRRRMLTLMQEGVGKGLLSDQQQEMAQRVLALGQMSVADVMVRWSKVHTLRRDQTVPETWTLSQQTGHSRFPVVDHEGQVQGVINTVETLLADRQPPPPLSLFVREPERFDRSVPVRTALRKLQRNRIHMAIVHERGRPIGVVTIKDLVEAITGELFDW